MKFCCVCTYVLECGASLHQIRSHCAQIMLCGTVEFYNTTTPMVTRMVVIKLPISVTPVLLLAPDVGDSPVVGME